MAFPQVTRGTAYNSAGSSLTAHPIPVPASVASGDLLVIMASVDGNAGTVSMTGFTELLSDPHSSSVRLWIGYKIAVGSESGTITLTTPSEQCTAQMWKITSWHGTTPPEVTSAEGTSANPDPPSLSPSWGSADTLWIAGLSMNGGPGTVSVYSLPDNQVVENSGGSGSSGHAFCSDELAQATLDPGTFTCTSQAWLAFTLAVRPSAGGPPTINGTAAGTFVLGSTAVGKRTVLGSAGVASSADSAYLASSVSGTATTPDNALGATDTTWTEDTGNTNWSHTWQSGTFLGDLVGTQTITVTLRARKSDGTDNPTINSVAILDTGGTQRGIDSTGWSVTSTTGENVVATVSCTGLTGTAVRVVVDTTGVGGPPAARSSVQLDSVLSAVSVIAPTFQFVGTAIGVIPSGTTGTALGSFTLTGLVNGKRIVKGTAQSSFTYGGSAVGQRTVKGTALGAFTLGAAVTGTVIRPGTATGAFTFTGTATGVKQVYGTAVSNFTFTALGVGQRTVEGTAQSGFTFTGTAVGLHTVEGVAVSNFIFTGTATAPSSKVGTALGAYVLTATAQGRRLVDGVATSNFTFSGTAVGQRTVKGVATGSFQLGSTATGQRTTEGQASSAFVFTGTALGVVDTQVNGTALGAYTLTATAVGQRTVKGVAVSNLTFSGTAVGKHTGVGVATGTLTFTGTAIGAKAGSAVGTLIFAGTATGQRAVKGVATSVLTFTGNAQSQVTKFGTAEGAFTFTGTAVGTDGSDGGPASSGWSTRWQGFDGFEDWADLTNNN